MARRRKPSKPKARTFNKTDAQKQEKPLKRSPEQCGLNLEAANLPQNANVQITAASPREKFARRVPWYERVLAKDSAEITAFERLSELVTIRRGEYDKGLDPILKNLQAPGTKALVNDRMLGAAEKIISLMVYMPKSEQAMILELVITSSDPNQWREVVAKFTGEKDRNSQAAIVRHIAKNLNEAWHKFDHATRKKAA
jgi:hypothetical protein